MSGGGAAEFGFGGALYPLTGSTTHSLLEDADPALAAALEFFPAVLDIEIGARLAAQAAREGLTIASAVLTKVTVEPIPVLFADRTRFPFFALYRKSETYVEHTRAWDKSLAEWEFAYVLPAFMPDAQQRLVPILRAVALVMRRTARMGWHPGYQDGADIWAAAGIMKVRLISVKYERYERMDSPTSQQFFRAVTGTLQVAERDHLVAGAYETFTGANIHLDHRSSGGTVEDLATLSTNLAPTITSITPNSGTKAGGTSVAVAGTGFFAPAKLTIGGVDVLATVVSSTSVTATTPEHAAYPTFMADVVLTNGDGQTARLAAGFTFTTP